MKQFIFKHKTISAIMIVEALTYTDALLTMKMLLDTTSTWNCTNPDDNLIT